MFLYKAIPIAIISSFLVADDFGLQGEIFPIQEVDIAHFLEDKMTSNKNSFDLGKESLQVKKRIESSFYADPPREAKIYHSRLFDPSYRVKDDIFDHTGKLICKKGTMFNPLESLTLENAYIFLDGTKKEQVEWAKKQPVNDTWILVMGNPFDLEKKENRPVYFDQKRVLSKFFGFQSVPTRISQSGKSLLIEEIPLDEK